MTDYQKAWITAIAGIIGAVLVSLVTHYLTVRKERRNQVNSHRLDILNNLLTPIYREIFNELNNDGYTGINGIQITSILKIAHDRLNLLDPILERYMLAMKERFRIGAHEERLSQEQIKYDLDKEFYYYLRVEYNKLRSELRLPYDRREVSIWFRIKNYFRP